MSTRIYTDCNLLKNKNKKLCLGVTLRVGRLVEEKEMVSPSYASCNGITKTCNGITKTCNGITKTCNGITKTCNGITKTCNGITKACNGITKTCNGITKTCNGVNKKCNQKKMVSTRHVAYDGIIKI